MPLNLYVVLFHLNIFFPPLLFLIVKHAETQSSSGDLATDIDKGKTFRKTILCVKPIGMNLLQLVLSCSFGNRRSCQSAIRADVVDTSRLHWWRTNLIDYYFQFFSKENSSFIEMTRNWIFLKKPHLVSLCVSWHIFNFWIVLNWYQI